MSNAGAKRIEQEKSEGAEFVNHAHEVHKVSQRDVSRNERFIKQAKAEESEKWSGRRSC
jgi:hypothetical protein